MSSNISSLKSISLSNSEGYTDPSSINIFHLNKSLSSSLFADLPRTPSSEGSIQVVDIEYDEEIDVEWADLEVTGFWGCRGLELNPWDDEERPLVKLKSYGELHLSEEEKKGVLTYKTLASCASYLDRCPVTKKFVICKYNLSNKLLRDISLLQYFHYIQYLDLSWNELTNLEPLGQCPFLMYLNASHNDITEVLAFKAPFYLTYVDLSFNLISKIPDLTEFWSIVSLDLSHNKINVIEGLHNLKYLRFLNLSYNEISTVENLNNLRIQTLCLHHNLIYKFEEGHNVGLKTLLQLKHLRLSHNHITSLKFLEGTLQVQNINLRENHINSLLELYYLTDLKYLTSVNFKGNPIAELPQYHDVCVDAMRQIMFIDGEYVDCVRKVTGRDKFSVEPQVLATAQIAKTLLLQQLNNTNICLPVFPYTSLPPSLLILVGPPGSRKSHLIKRLVAEMPKRTAIGVCHTTRQKTDDEIEDEDYHFVTREEFQDILRKGEFLTDVEMFGQRYGIRESELAKIATKGILVFHTDLSAALCLRAKNLKPVIILAMPRSEAVHVDWLQRRYHTEEIGSGLLKVESKSDASLTIPQSSSDIEELMGPDMDRTFKTASDSNRLEEMSVFCELKEQTNSASNIGILRKEDCIKEAKVRHHPSVSFKTKLNPSGDLQDLIAVEIFESVISCIDPAVKSASEAVIGSSSTPVLSALSEVQFTRSDGHETESTKLKGSVISRYIRDILALRQVYLQTHLDNPGLFNRFIFTDEPEKSMEILKDTVKFMCDHQYKPYLELSIEDDPAFESLFAKKMDIYRKHFRSSSTDVSRVFDAA